MQRSDDETNVDEAVKEIAALLAAAYLRRSRIRLVPTTAVPLSSAEGLANNVETSVHVSRLTAERKDSIQQ